MGAILRRSSFVLFLAVTLLAASGPAPVTASSRHHLHRHLESLNGPAGPDEHEFSFSNISQLIPNVTTNLFSECSQDPVNIIEWQNEVGNYVSSFYRKLLNATLLPGGGNIIVVRLANGSLSVINGNVTVSPKGQLIINGSLTTTGVFNGTLSLNQTLLNITSLATSIFQRAANLTLRNNSTLGSLVGSNLGGDPPVPGLNATSVDLPSIVFSPNLLSNTTQLLSYSPVTPDAILQYFRNLTAAALAAFAPGAPARAAENGPLNLNRAPAPPVAASGTSGESLPGFPDIKVYFFIIVARSTDRDVTSEILANQIAKMNAAYGASGYPSRFVLAGALYITKPDWVNGDETTEVFNQMKSQTRIGGPQDLNVWITTFLKPGLNGFATFPWNYTKGDQARIDGVVLSKYTLPMERTNPNYQAGRSVGISATHEVGHWLGLFHTFQGGCEGRGDTIDDTPSEGTATGPDDVCTVSKYSCPAGPRGPPDPIENFMDYGKCRRTFTAGQIVAMKKYWTLYRYHMG